MLARWHDSLAGKLLQSHDGPDSVGASLLANARLRRCLRGGTIRLQASSYKVKMALTL